MGALNDHRNKDFVQLYKNSMPELRWLSKKSGLAMSIMLFFMENMDRKNALACSYDVLQDYFECSRMTIYRAIKMLEENGFIGVLKSGNSNVYTVNTEVAWSSWNNKKKYARLDGVILISHKENKDYDISRQKEKFNTIRLREGIRSPQSVEAP